MNLRRWTALLLAGALAVLPACARPEPAKVTQPTKVQFWHAMPQDAGPGRLLQDLVREFNSAQTEVAVEAVYQGSYADLEQKLQAGAPEIIQVTDEMLARLTGAGRLQPLDDLIAPEEQGDYPYPLIQAGRRDGRLFALPFTRSATVLIYDPAKITAPPTTWEEFRETARRHSTPDRPGTVLAADMSTFGQYLTQAGGFWLQDGAPAFDSPAGIEALEFIAGMVREGSARLMGPREYATDLFNRGEVPMITASTASYPYIKPGSGAAWGVAPLPAGPRNGLVPHYGAGLALTVGHSQSKQRAAAKFLAWITGKEATLRLTMAGTGYLPVRKSALIDARWQAYVAGRPDLAILGEVQHRLVPQPLPPGLEQRRPAITSAVEKAMTGQSTPRQALTQAAKASQGNIR